MSITNGTRFSKRLTTARLFFKRTGDAYEHDLGNIVSWKRKDSHEKATHMKSEGGVRITDLAITRTIGFGYEVVLTEHNKNNIEMILRGTQSTTAYSQSSQTGVTIQFTSVEHYRTYSLGAFDVTSVVVEVSSVAKVEGTDYILDARSGRITILQTGSIASGATVDVTFNKPAITGISFTAGTQPQIAGDWTLVLSDQMDLVGVDTVAEIHTFNGSLHISDAGDNSDDFNQITAEIVCHTAPVVVVPTRA